MSTGRGCGKGLPKRSSELVERSFAHCYETAGMRRYPLRGRDCILKRRLDHASTFNLSLAMRQLPSLGIPRKLKNRLCNSPCALSCCTCGSWPNGKVELPRLSPSAQVESTARSIPNAGPRGIPLLAPRIARKMRAKNQRSFRKNRRDSSVGLVLQARDKAPVSTPCGIALSG
jgi:hypothetical protein